LVEQISTVSPQDTDFEHKLEPDSKGSGQTVLRSHVILGSVSSVFGLVIVGVLMTIGSAFATSSPVMMLAAAAILGAFIGLLIADAISIRPDHEQLINSARHATHHQWSVVVKTRLIIK
jgi:sterol desaturase/sphingolipid hydroxylase (fatty acid hydroxylase superfamily)